MKLKKIFKQCGLRQSKLVVPLIKLFASLVILSTGIHKFGYVLSFRTKGEIFSPVIPDLIRDPNTASHSRAGGKPVLRITKNPLTDSIFGYTFAVISSGY